MKLTQTSIEKLTYTKAGNAAQLHFDHEPKGFGVRVFPKGAKSFFFQYRVNRTSRRMTLGSVGSITLQQARTLAREAAHTAHLDKQISLMIASGM